MPRIRHTKECVRMCQLSFVVDNNSQKNCWSRPQEGTMIHGVLWGGGGAQKIFSANATMEQAWCPVKKTCKEIIQEQVTQAVPYVHYSKYQLQCIWWLSTPCQLRIHCKLWVTGILRKPAVAAVNTGERLKRLEDQRRTGPASWILGMIHFNGLPHVSMHQLLTPLCSVVCESRDLASTCIPVQWRRSDASVWWWWTSWWWSQLK